MLLKLRIKSFLGIFTVVFAMATSLFSGVAWGQTTYNTPGASTYTVPAGITCLQVQIWGAGGAGGSRPGTGQDGAGGGGGGGYTFALMGVTAGQIINLNVGAGGTAPIGSTTNGGNGGTSWFVTSGTYYATGGNGGTWGDATNPGTGGTGGTGFGGTNFNGGSGGAGKNSNTGVGGGGGSSAGISSNGVNGGAGSSPDNGFGATAPTGGGNGGVGGDNTTGGAGTSPGGGGGGGGESNGGNGGNGQIIVTPVNICDTYCTSSFAANTTGSISNVSFSTISNPTGWAGYTNYTSNCATVTTGGSNTLTVTIAGSSYVNNVWAYFDWNSDGDFSDAGEAIDLG